MLGEALLSISEPGETLTCPVLFAPAGSVYLLRATALENFGVEADPTERRIKPIAAVIGGHLASSAPKSMQRELSQTEEITEIIQFIEQSARGIIR
jgi:hypothetical protein